MKMSQGVFVVYYKYLCFMPIGMELFYKKNKDMQGISIQKNGGLYGEYRN